MKLTWFGHLKKTLAWTIRAIVIGLVCGPSIALLAAMISAASQTRHANPALILAIPLGAVVTAYLFKTLGPHLQEGTIRIMSVINRSAEGTSEALGQPTYVESVTDGDGEVSTKLAPLLLATTLITHLVGASGGKEGVGVQIGSSLASYLGEAESRLRGRPFSVQHQGLWLIAGAASGFAALFGAPVAGVLFGLQFSNPRVNRTDAFLPALVAAYTATLSSQALHIKTIETVTGSPMPLTLTNLGSALLAALFFGLFSRLFCWTIHQVRRVVSTITNSFYVRSLFTSSLLLAASLIIYLLVGSFEYNGLSTHLIADAGRGASSAWAPLFKFILTILTIASGFIGGEVVPILVIGSTAGSLLASFFGLPVATFAMFGAVGMLSGSTKLPLACFALALELFGFSNPAMVFFVCAVSYFISGPASIYQSEAE